MLDGRGNDTTSRAEMPALTILSEQRVVCSRGDNEKTFLPYILSEHLVIIQHARYDGDQDYAQHHVCRLEAS